MQIPANSNATTTGRSVGLWAGVLGSAAAWGIQLQVVYALAPWLCSHGMYVITHLVSLLFLLLVVGLGWLSAQEWKKAGGGSPDARGGTRQERSRFLGGLGVFSCVLFAALIICQALPAFFFDGCWL